MASADEINSTLKGIVANLSGEVSAINLLATTIIAAAGAIVSAIPPAQQSPIISNFTLSNATVTVVTDANVTPNTMVVWEPRNGTAALTLRTQGLFISAYTVGVSFSVSTQNGSALGTELFQYIIFPF